jgi:hypothetical protein
MTVHLKLDTLELPTAVIFLCLWLFSVVLSVTMGRGFMGKVKKHKFHPGIGHKGPEQE